MQASDDEQILLRLKAGSHEAFEQIYKKFWKTLFQTAYSLTRDKDISEDLLQELFTGLWNKRELLAVDDLEVYLKAAIRNNSLKSIAKGKVSETFYKTLDMLNATTSPSDSSVIEKELHDAYVNLIKHMPEKRQKIFRLRFEEELSTNRIAEKLGITRKTVQNQLLRSYAVIETLLSVLATCIINFF